MNMWFEPSFNKWSDKDYSRSCPIIKDISMDIVALVNPKDKNCEHGKTYVEVVAPPIYVNLSPLVYNWLVNIHKMFIVKD